MGGPITGIVSGCSDERKASVLQRHQQSNWPPQFKLHFVPTYNDETSLWMSKPFGVRSWYHSVGPERDVVAVLDPDFVFLRPLTADLDGSTAIEWEGEIPKRVQKGVVVAQRYSLEYPEPDNMNLFQLELQSDGKEDPNMLSYVCSGSRTAESGCTNITQREVGLYQSTGVPYLAHRDDWRWLVDSWADVMGRLHKHYVGDQLYADMYSWILANAHRRQRQLVLHNYIFSSVQPPQSDYERWAPIDALALDSCANPVGQVLTQKVSASLPHFIHYCVPLDDSFNKYWFDWRAESGPHVLEKCEDGSKSEALGHIMTTVQNKTVQDMHEIPNGHFQTLKEQHRARFLGCTMRSFFKGALRRSCGDRPSSVFVSGGQM